MALFSSFKPETVVVHSPLAPQDCISRMREVVYAGPDAISGKQIFGRFGATTAWLTKRTLFTRYPAFLSLIVTPSGSGARLRCRIGRRIPIFSACFLFAGLGVTLFSGLDGLPALAAVLALALVGAGLYALTNDLVMDGRAFLLAFVIERTDGQRLDEPF